MRRKEKQITEINEIDKIINSSQVCRIALSKNDIPYIVPVSFGYDGKYIFIHTAKEGKKINFIQHNNKVSFEFDTNVRTIAHDNIPCKWTTAFQSIIGFGQIIEITKFEEAQYALNQIMLQYSGKQWVFNEKMLKSVKVWKIKIEEMTGKESNMKLAW